MSHPTPSQEADAALTWAERYAGYGWSVVPVHCVTAGRCSCHRASCPSVAKHPRVRWEHAMAEAATSEQLARWWRRWPNANVGVVTGVVSGVAVLDVDPRNDGDDSLRHLERRFGVIAVTPEVRTGGGGRHLWLSVDGELPSVALAPGVDLKAEGGMVVVPPSVHATGRRYVWRPGGTPDDVALAQVPEWVRDLVHDGAGHEVTGAPDSRAAPLRTSTEQAEFADAWARAGVQVVPGDRYYLCPFHADHHPSLHIDAEGCRWYCFGCTVGGGIGRLRRLLGELPRPRPRSRLRRVDESGRAVTLQGTREQEIVGESHHQDELLELTGGRRRFGGVDVETVAELVPTPNNPYDPDAVEVRIESRVVGHIARDDLDWLRPIVDTCCDRHGVATCRARIRGGWDRGHGEVGSFGVVLLLPTPVA